MSGISTSSIGPESRVRGELFPEPLEIVDLRTFAGEFQLSFGGGMGIPSLNIGDFVVVVEVSTLGLALA